MAIVSQTYPINFLLTASVRGRFSLGELQTAVNKACQKHPTLNSLVAHQDNGQAFLVPNDSPHFPVEEQTDSSWQAIANVELNRPFDLTVVPAIRFILLRHDNEHADIIVVCAHALADGFSAAYLIHDLLAVLGNDNLTLTPKAALPPFSALIPDFKGKWLTIFLAKLKARLFKTLIKILPTKSELLDKVFGDYHFLTWRLSSEQTTSLLSRCRAEQTTVHAALGVAFLRAFAERRQDGWRREIQSPVSIRSRLAQPLTDDYGMFINLMAFKVDCSLERDYWAVARDIRQGFLSRMNDSALFREFVEAEIILETLSAIITPDSIAQSMPRVAYDLSITNLGRLTMPEPTDKLQLEALYGPCVGGNPDEVVLGVNSVNGRLHFSMLYRDAKMSWAQGEQIRDGAMNWLAKAIS